MSTSPEFDLEKLFLPSWAQESSSVNQYAQYRGDDRPPDRDRKFGDRPGGGRGGPRRDGPRTGGGGGHRPENRGPRPEGAPRGPRPEGQARPDFRGPRPEGAGAPRGPRRDDRGPARGRGFEDRRDRPAPLPMPEVNLTLMPDDKGVDSIARQIKMSGRSFPLFDIAGMILQKPDRQQVRFEIRKKPDGTAIQPLFLCAIDDTLWLSEDEAVEHVFSKHFGMFYQTEKIATEPPKGTYTFVAQCGMSGVILGPPNHHDYQNQLHKLHTERFSRMPFDAFKARVKIVREEEVVKKWVEEQSFKTEFIALNVPEPLRFLDRDGVNKHFREVHQPNIIKPVEKHTLTGLAARQLRSPGLQRLIRFAFDEQRRFPLQIATILSQQFASRGLQFFKVNKTITHVSVARPHYLDLEVTPVSDQVRKIVDFINGTPRATRRQLIEKLAPAPAHAPVAPVQTPSPAPATESAPAADGATAEAAAPAAPPAPVHPAEPPPTPEQASLIGDLHWLIHQGHVIEFANGVLETAKRPLPKPVRPPKAPAKVEPVAGETPAAAAQPPVEAEHTSEAMPEHASTAAPEAAPVAQETHAHSEPAHVESAPADNGSAPAPAPETT